MFSRISNVLRATPAGHMTLAVSLAAAGAAFLTLDMDANAANRATAAVTSYQGKGDALCAKSDRPPTEMGCLRRLRQQTGQQTTVRLVGRDATVAERPLTERERLESAFRALEPSADPESVALR